MEHIINYLLAMTPYMLLALPLILIFRYVRSKTLKKKGITTTILHECALILYLLFLIGLASQTIMPNITLVDGIPTLLETGRGNINLDLFKVFRQTYQIAFVRGYFPYFLINFVGNIIIFIPIGSFTPLLWHKINFLKASLVGFSMSLTIELCQLPLARGTDVDDLWLNTLGAMCGYVIYYLLEKYHPEFCQKCKTKT